MIALHRYALVAFIATQLAGEACAFGSSPSLLSMKVHHQRRMVGLSLRMSGDHPEKVMVCNGPTCSKSGGKKALEVSSPSKQMTHKMSHVQERMQFPCKRMLIMCIGVKRVFLASSAYVL